MALHRLKQSGEHARQGVGNAYHYLTLYTAQHAPAQAMHQPTPTPPVAADEAPAPPSLPEEPAGAAEVAPTRAVVAAAASAAAVPSIGDKRSVGGGIHSPSGTPLLSRARGAARRDRVQPGSGATGAAAGAA